MWRWLKALGRWGIEAWRAWAALGVVTLVLLIGLHLPGNADDRIRYCGLALELLGISTVALGLRDKRRLFNRPGLVELLRSWVKRLPQWRPKTQTISVAGIASSSAVGTASISVWHGVPADATIETRLAALEAKLETVRKELADASKQLRGEAASISSAVDTERRARESTDKQLWEQVEAFGVGSLHLEAVGLFWLILGVISATASAEVANLLRFIA